ncbi:Aldehyde reductase 2 [Talaromyces islandicus]|uniref:Aldehyde reductase 2 n=1 Tax=Talaromyces islandicus TaxID=28573 RepID=A0A0U1M776_TALIS|nr:Aldehyde reductase 2 [Talaromyces islandicus]
MSMSVDGPKAINPGERVLVTGANGYIGSHVVDFLLSLGYIVRGTVRAEKPWLNQFFDTKYGYGKFETTIIPRLDDQKALTEALSDTSGVVHVASDVSFEASTAVRSYVVSATEAVLDAAAKASVTRVVLTSSLSAVLVSRPGVEGIVVTENTWNDFAVKLAHDENIPADERGIMIYAASKTEGERAAWRWIKENKPTFIFNTVLPDFTIGQVLCPEVRGSTMNLTSKLLEGNDTIMKVAPPQHYIDVKDLARIHAVALLDPKVQSERIFGMAYPFTWKEIISVLRELRPSNGKLVNPPEDEPKDLSNVLPSKRAKDLLRSFFGQSDWTELRESLESGITSLGL